MRRLFPTLLLALAACDADAPAATRDASAVDAVADVDVAADVDVDAVADGDMDAVEAGDADADTSSVADTAAADVVVPPADAVDPDAPVVGRWAQLQVQSALNDVPFVGEVVATTRTVLLVDVVPDGDAGHVATQRVCAVTLDSGTELVSTLLPNAAVAAIAPASRAVTTDDATVRFAQLTEIWGAALADPETGALPTAPDDPRVVDHEGDGHPGMTVRVSGLLDGEIYLVQRGRTTLEGTFTTPDTLDGRLTWSQEQVILASDNVLLENPIPSRVNPDADASYFRSTRVAAELDCAAALATEAALFAR